MSVGDLFMLVLHFVSARDSMSKSLFSPFPLSRGYLRPTPTYVKNPILGKKRGDEWEDCFRVREYRACDVSDRRQIFTCFVPRRDGMFGLLLGAEVNEKDLKRSERGEWRGKVSLRDGTERCARGKIILLMCHRLFRGFTVPRVRRISLRLEFRENCKLQPQITLPFLTSWNLISGLRRKSIRPPVK